MTFTDFLLFLAIAGVCGAIGQAIAGRSRTGCIGSIALGFIGALVGRLLARELHLPDWAVVTVGGASFPIVWSIAGSALFVAIVSFLTRRN